MSSGGSHSDVPLPLNACSNCFLTSSPFTNVPSASLMPSKRAGSATTCAPPSTRPICAAPEDLRTPKHSATATTGYSRPLEACTVMMRTAPSPSSLRAPGASLPARKRSKASAMERGELPNSASASATASSALSTLAAMALPSGPRCARRTNQPEALTTSRAMAANESRPTRRSAYRRTSRARVTSGRPCRPGTSKSLMMPASMLRREVSPVCSSSLVASAKNSWAPSANIGDASSGIRPCAVSAGLASAQTRARTVCTSAACAKTEPPAMTQSSPWSRKACA